MSNPNKICDVYVGNGLLRVISAKSECSDPVEIWTYDFDGDGNVDLAHADSATLDIETTRYAFNARTSSAIEMERYKECESRIRFLNSPSEVSGTLGDISLTVYDGRSIAADFVRLLLYFLDNQMKAKIEFRELKIKDRVQNYVRFQPGFGLWEREQWSIMNFRERGIDYEVRFFYDNQNNLKAISMGDQFGRKPKVTVADQKMLEPVKAALKQLEAKKSEKK